MAEFPRKSKQKPIPRPSDAERRAREKLIARKYAKESRVKQGRLKSRIQHSDGIARTGEHKRVRQIGGKRGI